MWYATVQISALLVGMPAVSGPLVTFPALQALLCPRAFAPERWGLSSATKSVWLRDISTLKKKSVFLFIWLRVLMSSPLRAGVNKVRRLEGDCHVLYTSVFSLFSRTVLMKRGVSTVGQLRIEQTFTF